jgi:hypothetical protein
MTSRRRRKRDRPTRCEHPTHVWVRRQGRHGPIDGPCLCGHYKTYAMYEAIRGLATPVLRGQ